jgi:TonB family protein
MKKALTFILILLFFTSKTYSQTLSEEYNSIQKFIESTVQIPFMARVADVQGAVRVRITMGSDSLPVKYEITQSLRPDCDLEALRVVKLVNVRYLRETLKGKKKMLIEVPFFNKSFFSFEKGFVIEYFNGDNKPTTNEPDIRLLRRYPVDTLTGIITGDIAYFEYKKGKFDQLGIAMLKMDNSSKNSPNFLESPQDTIRYRTFYIVGNNKYPIIRLDEIFENGQIRTKNMDGSKFIYYSNGRIEKQEIYVEKGKEKITNSFNWFANGQLESIKILSKIDNKYSEKIIAVWDTLGKQLVKDGNGVNESFYGNINNVSFETGLVQDSLKEGKWIAKSVKGVTDYEEIYQKGVLIEGKSFSGNQIFPYKSEQNAEYKGGIPRFGAFLSRNLTYPSAAQKANIEGQVYVQFVVCTDGTLCDYKVLRGVGFGCDEEAVRVIKLSSGKWEAGKQRGRAVRSRFTIPINFSLGR